MKITANGRTEEFQDGCTYREIADRFQNDYALRIILVQNGSKYYELHKKATQDAQVTFVTMKDKSGMMTYQRSAIFMMLKAFHEICGDTPGFDVTVDYTLGGGFYCYLHGDIAVSDALLKEVKEKMHEYQNAALPLIKESVKTDEAIRYFKGVGMTSKEHLMRYRMTSRVNLYSVGDFKDYFYGAMVMDFGYITLFDLIPYGDGFVLLLPTQQSPDRLPAFKPMDKLYTVQKESVDWANKVGVSNIGQLNDQVVAGQSEHLILMQEAIFEKKIGDVAAQVAEGHKKVVLIAGPSSSGKTTFSKRLSIQLQAIGLKPHTISVDNYYRDRKYAPKDENGNYDFESIECLDLPKFGEDMNALLRGERVELPRYNFLIGEREYRGDYLTLGAEDILVIEGIHCLNERMSEAFPSDTIFRIYISALTQLNVDEHNRIPSTDCRLLRRMVRDNRTRGYSAEATIGMWGNVRKGEEKYIFPYQENADVMVNSAMLYELSVIKIFAQPLLFQIPEDSPAYLEAKRLLKFLDYVLPISPEHIPHNSIVREFIGGSCLDVG